MIPRWVFLLPPLLAYAWLACWLYRAHRTQRAEDRTGRPGPALLRDLQAADREAAATGLIFGAGPLLLLVAGVIR